VLRAVDVLNIAGSVTQATFTWDALGRRIEFVNADFDQTTEYWYDGVKEIDEKTTQDGEIPTYSLRYYIHGISYVDEHLLMLTGTKPYYYVLDRMYNVRLLLDRAGAIVERYAYDSYGRFTLDSQLREREPALRVGNQQSCGQSFCASCGRSSEIAPFRGPLAASCAPRSRPGQPGGASPSKPLDLDHAAQDAARGRS